MLVRLSRLVFSLQPQHRLDDAEARTAEVEQQIEALRLSNTKVSTRNALLVRAWHRFTSVRVLLSCWGGLETLVRKQWSAQGWYGIK